MIAKLRLWWQRNQQLALIAEVVIIVFIAFALALYFFGWEWTGLSAYTSPPHAQNTYFQPAKTLWDWLQLAGVIAIPIAVAWFSNRQSHDAQISADNQREAALQIYIDKMSELLLEKGLAMSSPDFEVRKIARARTLTVLSGLDGNRKRTVLQFLYSANLLSDKDAVIDLSSADLSSANLDRITLAGVHLRGADLTGAHLNFADLRGVDLAFANLRKSDLNSADLSHANLKETYLRGADLSHTNLSGANLSSAYLQGANLSSANYSTKPRQGTDAQGNPLTLEPTLWPQGFDPKAAGVICVDC